MQKIFRILMLMLVTALAACGGGGGDGGSPGANPNQPSLVTTAGESINLEKGVTREFQISGGVPPYRVVNPNPAIATASVEGNVLRVRSENQDATVSVSVMDYSGMSIAIEVIVGAGSPATPPEPPTLFSTAPSALNMRANTSRGEFEITGGSTPYNVTSTDESVATVRMSSSNKFIIIAVAAGKADIVISDRGLPTPATQKISVTVDAASAFFIDAPDTVKLDVSSRATYKLAGGTPLAGNKAYSVVSDDTSVATGRVEGAVLTVETTAKAGTATLRLTDAVGATVDLTVEVVTNNPTTPGTPSTPIIKEPSISGRLLGTTDNSVSASGYTTLEVTLAAPSGRGIPNQLIKVSDDSGKIIFPEGDSGLTNASGVASIKLGRASLTATGAGSLTVNYSYKSGTWLDLYPHPNVVPPSVDTVVSTYVGYQLATANITLDNLNVGTGSLPAYGTRQVSVQVNLNGVATTTPVQVNFSATCGQISPATASTNALGQVTVSYSATDAAGAAQSSQGCSGKTVEISASTIGAAVKSATLTVTGAPATNMAFVSATPARIYLANSGGATQSLVKFKLINAQGEPILGRDVELSLKTVAGGAIDATKATFNIVGNIQPITVPTDANGEVSVPVFSGTVPTNVLVHAKLKPLLPTDPPLNPAIETDSAVLTIASGRPAQARVSLSIEKFAIEGFNVDGDESTVTMSLADRQGNPVPDGTAVNFVTEGGVMIPPVCTTGITAQGNSQCTVKIRSQNPRPTVANPNINVPEQRTGRVTILAYAAGEEDFVDANFNNVYDCTEAWNDLGTAYRNDDESTNPAFTTGEFSIPRQADAARCNRQTQNPSPGDATPMTSVSTAGVSKGDNVWGAADVRGQHTIIFATSEAEVTPINVSPDGVSFKVADKHGNSMPTGSQITVTAVDNTENGLACTVAAGGSTVVPNSLDPFLWSASLSKCAAGDSVMIDVKAPKTNTITRIAELTATPIYFSAPTPVPTTIPVRGSRVFVIRGYFEHVVSDNQSVATVVSSKQPKISTIDLVTGIETITQYAETKVIITGEGAGDARVTVHETSALPPANTIAVTVTP